MSESTALEKKDDILRTESGVALERDEEELARMGYKQELK